MFAIVIEEPPRSMTTKQKDFFDTHLDPLHIIEKLNLRYYSSFRIDPSIVTKKNIKLLFEMKKRVNTV